MNGKTKFLLKMIACFFLGTCVFAGSKASAPGNFTCTEPGVYLVTSEYNGVTSTTTIVCEEANFTLTVQKAGLGTITSSPFGIDCGSACSASFASGSEVTLSASPAAGFSFTGWSGGECGGTGDCNVSIMGNENIGATFNYSKPDAPANPKVTNVKGQVDCENVKFTWEDASGETGYKIYEDGTEESNVVRQTSANITQDTHKPQDIFSHQYYIASTNNGIDSDIVFIDSIAALPCEASLSTSNKTIIKVNDTKYNAETAILKEGDTVDFKITLSNSGNIVAKLKKITDYFTNLTVPGDNFTNWAKYCRDFNLTDCDYIPHGSITLSGTNKPNEILEFNLEDGSYDIPSGLSRYLVFKAKITAPSNFIGSNSRIQNSALIKYHKNGSQEAQRTVSTPVLIFSRTVNAPNIHEVPN